MRPAESAEAPVLKRLSYHTIKPNPRLNVPAASAIELMVVKSSEDEPKRVQNRHQQNVASNDCPVATSRLRLCRIVIDIYAQRIVGWRASATPSTSFVRDALEQTLHAHWPGLD